MDAVVLEFSVPRVTCTQDRQALSIWAGFGGLVERSLAQAGVQVICEGTNARYNLFEQFTNGTGASTEGPQVSPGDYVRVVICPGRSGSTAGVCVPAAPNTTDYMTSVAFKRGTEEYQTWTESLTPNTWTNTRREAGCIVERPRDAATLQVLDHPQFTPPAMRCLPYRSISPINRVNIAEGGAGYTAYRINLIAEPNGEPKSGSDGPLPPGPLDPLTGQDTRTLTATGNASPDEGAQNAAPDDSSSDASVGGSPMTVSP